VAGISSARWWIRRFGAGWGYRLLNHLLADADEVSVDTAEVNAAAIALYHKAGFVLEQRWSVPDGLVLWRMLYQAGRLQPVLHLEPSGWVREARQCRHPIVMPGSMASPELLVIHNISLPPYRYGSQAVEQLFTNSLNPDEDPFFATISQLRVSSHFFIRRSGQLVQFVPVQPGPGMPGSPAGRGASAVMIFPSVLRWKAAISSPLPMPSTRCCWR
jgi:AmpD protein